MDGRRQEARAVAVSNAQDVTCTGATWSMTGGGANGGIKCADTQANATGSSACHTSKLCPPWLSETSVTDSGAFAAAAIICASRWVAGSSELDMSSSAMSAGGRCSARQIGVFSF
jgi:hypothetical protein